MTELPDSVAFNSNALVVSLFTTLDSILIGSFVTLGGGLNLYSMPDECNEMIFFIHRPDG